MGDKQKNGRSNIGRRRSIMRSAAEIALDERMRQKFIRLVKSNGAAPSRMIQEIIEGRHKPWRSSARRSLELMDTNLPTGEIKAVVLGELDTWIDEQAAIRRLDPAA